LEQITFGAYSVPVILAILLSVIFRFCNEKIHDKWKALIAVICGVFLGILSIPYQGLDWIAPIIIDRSIYGFMMGASAIGIYELQRTVTKPRK